MGIISTLRKLFHREGRYRYEKRSLKRNTSMSTPETIEPTGVSTEGSSRNQSSSNGTNHIFRDGRRYHGDTEVAYILPNDDDEADRVHQQHWLLRYALQGNFSSPVKKQLEEGINVLDSGCGPATWTFEMGETYPRSKIYGIDASCVFPENIMPPNVEFVIGNIAKEIPYEDNFFGFVHQRLLILGLTDTDWTNTLAQLFRVLKPGGYIECNEACIQELLTVGPNMKALQNAFMGMMVARQIPFLAASELEERLKKAGFVDVQVKLSKIPLNHGGKVGKLLWEDYFHVYTNARPALVFANPEWEDPEVYAKLLRDSAEESKQNKGHILWYSVHGRKPFDTTTDE
ncbi:hypothetical protein INT47_013251 [Mucor saturninus]|uniref:S-adenosyl-L-methionine-dependent methyltransferase n=1 Tax=Mucor saturninus TaxID=64648 RepID=A0A8H7R352_9FUNG|nr:hypothetical protein INT47_013251 [Mucor saturninus]